MEPLKIAVVGSGVAGLSAAWLLSRTHRLVVLERAERLGGHAHTVDVVEDRQGVERRVPIDTGFIVYNTACYPNLIALFDHLGVPTAPTKMTFAVSLGNGAYEYAGSARGLMGQPANLFKPAHWQLVRDVLRFFREADGLAALEDDVDTSLADWLNARGYSQAFIARHIRPMAAAIWSTPSKEVLDFPAAAFARFFQNHGLLQVRNRPQWRTVRGGSREYVTRIADALRTGHGGTGVPADVRTGQGVRSVARRGGKIDVAFEDGSRETFDRVLFATHADEALAMIEAPSADERKLLGAFRYARNETYLHRDARLMPKRRHLWASWNYVGDETDDALCVSYHMNTLQPLDTARDYIVTLNPITPIRDETILGHWTYTHPIFDRAAMTAQRELGRIQGLGGIWHAGAYMGYGFHECGAQAGLAAAEAMGGPGVRRPWQVANENDRVAYLSRAALRAAAAPLAEAAE
ncbi:MAG: hypothetical protein RL291_1164 [Pseudomonadota bacterium]